MYELSQECKQVDQLKWLKNKVLERTDLWPSDRAALVESPVSLRFLLLSSLRLALFCHPVLLYAVLKPPGCCASIRLRCQRSNVSLGLHVNPSHCALFRSFIFLDDAV